MMNEPSQLGLFYSSLAVTLLVGVVVLFLFFPLRLNNSFTWSGRVDHTTLRWNMTPCYTNNSTPEFPPRLTMPCFVSVLNLSEAAS